MNNNIIIVGNGNKYINKYIIGEGGSELHITDNRDIDYTIIIDTEQVYRMIKYLWRLTFVGKEGYKKPQVYAYIDRQHKLYLNRFILNNYNVNKILFINRDPYDFREKNLVIYNRGNIEGRDRDRHNMLGMSNIRELFYNNTLVSYQVLYIDGDKHRSKSFNVSKLGGRENALKLAKQFRDSQLESR